MSDTKKDNSKDPKYKHVAAGVGVTVAVVGLLLLGGWAGWRINDAMAKPGSTTPTTALAASHDTTTTAGGQQGKAPGQ